MLHKQKYLKYRVFLLTVPKINSLNNALWVKGGGIRTKSVRTHNKH